MEVKRLSALELKIYKTLNKLNLALIEEVSHRTNWLTHRLNNTQQHCYVDKFVKNPSQAATYGIYGQFSPIF